MADKFVMLVEGPDDYHVFQHLLTVHGINQQISYRLEPYRSAPKLSTVNEIVFREREGVQNVLDYLSQQLKITGDLKCIGVVIDADSDIAIRWQSLRDILRGAGYAHMPKALDPSGTVIEQEDKPRVGIWIMPNNILPGKIEDFIAFLVPEGDPLWSRAAANIQQIPEEERRFTADAFIKAHIHTWLAWQEHPGLPMGQAITRRYLNAEAPHALQWVAWLRRLFDLDSEQSGKK